MGIYNVGPAYHNWVHGIASTCSIHTVRDQLLQPHTTYGCQENCEDTYRPWLRWSHWRNAQDGCHTGSILLQPKSLCCGCYRHYQSKETFTNRGKTQGNQWKWRSVRSRGCAPDTRSWAAMGLHGIHCIMCSNFLHFRCCPPSSITDPYQWARNMCTSLLFSIAVSCTWYLPVTCSIY